MNLRIQFIHAEKGFPRVEKKRRDGELESGGPPLKPVQKSYLRGVGGSGGGVSYKEGENYLEKK